MSLTSPTLAVAGLYAALLGRAPDAGGFAFWQQATSNGASTRQLAETFLGSAEGLATFPAGQTNEQFVTRFYTSVFGRAPDPEGLAFWTSALAAQGNASSLAARATLVVQILDVVSAQLTAKPADLNDAAYLQTVADRARFANQAEFGVYFATELKSDNVKLAKSALALITDNPATLATARQFAANGGISPAPTSDPTPAPSLALTRADSVTDIAAKFAAYPGASATVDATGMSAAQLAAVAAGNTKIAADGVTKLTLPLGDALIVDAAVTALLSKTSAAKVDATGANASRLALLNGVLDQVADDGITGDLALTNDLTATQFLNLLGTKTALAANVVVDATGIEDITKFDALVGGTAKVDAINNLSLGLNLVSDWMSTALLDKASSGTRATTTGASVAAIAKLVDKISAVAAGGLSGELTLTSTQLATVTASTLNTKLASGFALSVVGDGVQNTINLNGLTQGVTVSGGAGANTITLGSGVDKVILGGAADTRSGTIVGTDTDTTKIDKIANFARTDKIQLSTAADAYGAGITFSSTTVLGGGDANLVPNLAIGSTPANFDELFSALNSGALGAIAPTASTSSVAQVAYIYFSNEGNLKGGYLGHQR